MGGGSLVQGVHVSNWAAALPPECFFLPGSSLPASFTHNPAATRLCVKPPAVSSVRRTDVAAKGLKASHMLPTEVSFVFSSQ